jgi:hypothetical protein
MDEPGLSHAEDGSIRRLHCLEEAGVVLSAALQLVQAGYLARDRRDRVREAQDVVTWC